MLTMLAFEKNGYSEERERERERERETHVHPLIR